MCYLPTSNIVANPSVNIMLILYFFIYFLDQVMFNFCFCFKGIGGDAFCLFYCKKTNKVQGINASGRAPDALTLEYLNTHCYDEHNKFPMTHGLSVTVPGACAG